MSTRTFVAITAPPAMCKRAEQLVSLLRPHTTDVKWVNAANYHWTLQFLGEVDDTDLAKVCDAVARATRLFEPFTLVATGAGAFPSANRPRVLWIGAGQGSQQGSQNMIDLQDSIAEELAAIGFGSDNRRYVPHLTLGRIGRTSRPADLAKPLSSFSDFDAGTMEVEEVIVYGSQLTGEGPIHHVIGRSPLQPV